MEPADKVAELTAIIQEVRDRVRARYPESGGSLDRALDLMPLLHARDAAEAKVAAIGTVNPRRGGPLNAFVQSIKKLIARGLGWHVREQIEFNRQVMACVEATLQALNEIKRTLARTDPNDVRDLRSSWSQWRAEWEHKLFVNETQFLRSVADLQGSFQSRVTQMEANFRDISRGQHADYLAALDRSANELQTRFWQEAAKARLEYERLIHEELRLVRQRAVSFTTPAHAPQSQSAPALPFDYGRFAERFRGSQEYVRKNIQFYLPRFRDRAPVLDLGCGRGEFLEMLRDAGVEARGIDQSEESVAFCRQNGLPVERADLFTYLEGLPDRSLGGIFCSQVVEHLEPLRLPELIRMAASKLSRGGLLAIETPNPECLAIFASHFYLDPTHTRPIPPPLTAFYMEESGLGQIEICRLSPAVESMPSLAALPEDFRKAFFGGLDYAAFGIKL